MAAPVDLARQIARSDGDLPPRSRIGRLRGGEAQSRLRGTSPNLSSSAAPSMDCTRRAQWLTCAPAISLTSRPPMGRRVAELTSYELRTLRTHRTSEPYDPYATPEAHEPDEPRAPRVSYAPLIKAWLPRVATLVVVLGIAGAIVSFWPQIRGVFSSTAARFERPAAVSEPVEVTEKPVVPQPTAKPEPDPLSKVSGWVAVFSPFDIIISEGGRGVQVDERGRAMLSPGRHRLRFQNRELDTREAPRSCETGRYDQSI